MKIPLILCFCCISFVATYSRAEAPPSVPATDMKPFTQSLAGSEIAFEMLPIPAGTFQIGSPDSEKGRKKDEGPQVEIKVDGFWMGKTVVTWAEYNLFLSNYQRLAGSGAPRIPADKRADAVTYPTPMYELEAGPVLDRMGRGGKNPAVIMSQYAAKQYTKWLSKRTGRFYRLPTEAEWEYACRAGTTTAYSFGDDPDKLKDFGWYIDDSNLADGDGAYHKVGEKKPNPWGLLDMHGNVAQWCLDQYEPDHYKKFAGKGTVDWHDFVAWPTKQYPRVIRGGSWQSEPDECRSAARVGSNKEMNVKDPQLPQSPHWLSNGFWIGFRVVAPVKEPTEEEKLKFWEADDDNTKRIVDTRDREIREIIAPTPQAKAP